MKRYFIFQEGSRFKFELRTIFSPDQHRLILVTKKCQGVVLTDRDRQCFSEILYAEDFSDRLLIEMLEPYLGEAKNTWFITHEELSVRLVARLRERFSVEGPKEKDVLPFTDKLKMKERVMGHGICCPKHVSFSPVEYRKSLEDYFHSLTTSMGLPLFAKRTDSTCSHGAFSIETMEDFKKFSEINMEESYEIDELINGTLFHVDSVIYNNEAIRTHVCEYFFPNDKFLQGKPLGSIILPEESEDNSVLRGFNQEVLRSLSPLMDGITHLEVFLSPQKKPIFLEIAARSPGALIPRVYEMHSGLNFQELFFKLQMRQLVSIQPLKGPHIAWCWMPYPRDGSVAQLYEPEIFSKYSIQWHAKKGDKVGKSQTVRDRICEMILQNDDFDTLKKDFDYLRNVYIACDIQ